MDKISYLEPHKNRTPWLKTVDGVVVDPEKIMHIQNLKEKYLHDQELSNVVYKPNTSRAGGQTSECPKCRSVELAVYQNEQLEITATALT